MSSPKKIIDTLIEQRLLNLHTAYFAKVLSVSDDTAKIQPLFMAKEKGEKAQKRAVLTAPILKNVKKLSTQTMTINGSSVTLPKVTNIEEGDVVYVMCAERDISEAKHGKCYVPALGHHRISDSVIVGVL